jgi:Dyp-type peroxidase family
VQTSRNAGCAAARISSRAGSACSSRRGIAHRSPSRSRVIGRFKHSGAPLTGKHEHDAVDLDVRQAEGLPVIATDAHIRLAGHAANDGERILRRGYSYTDGIDPVTGQLDAGLFFVAFQRDPHKQFAAIQRRLGANDSLNEYIRHTSSALFAAPRGVARGGYIGEDLFR